MRRTPDRVETVREIYSQSSSPFEIFEIPGWWERFGVRAGITGRRGSPDFRLDGSQTRENARRSWNALAAWARPEFQAIVVSPQVHGSRVCRHLETEPGWHLQEPADGHVTGTPGTLLAVTVADCVPVYLWVPGSGTLGLLHVGWRGLASGIVETGIETVLDGAEAHRSDLVMHCGISICGDCYEVGSEVLEALGRESQSTDGKGRVDLRAEIGNRARAKGVREISVSDWCTRHHGQRFFSHRGSGGTDWRMVAYAGIPLLTA